MRRALLPLLCALAVLPCRAAEEPVLDEVVVEGASPVLRQPAAEDVIDGARLETERIRHLEQLPAPTLAIRHMGGRATPHFVSLRGFTNPWSAPESALAVYLDGVPLSDLHALDQRLFDIASIRLRRGPQGTGFGMNSVAGVMEITTAAPTAVRQAWAQLSASHPDGGHAMEAGAAGALAPRLNGRLAVSVDGAAGYVDNLEGRRPYNARQGRDLHGRLAWQPAAGGEIGLVLLDRQVDDRGGELYLPVDTAAFNQLPTLQGRQLGRFDQALDHEGYNRLDATQAALTARWAQGGLRWQAVGSWRRSVAATSTDYDLSPQPWFVMASRYRLHQAHAELRADSGTEVGEAAWWLAGLSLDQRTQDTRRLFHAGPGNPWALAPGSYVRTDVSQPDHSAALFGEAGRRFGDAERWGLAAGMRLEHDTRRLAYGPTALAPGVADRQRDLQWLPKVMLDLRPAPGQQLYATLALGGKAAGFNPGSFDGSSAGFRAERTLASELGLKGRQGGDLNYTLALFRNDIRDYQDLVIAEQEFAVYIANAPRARTQGLEATLAWRPAEAWEVGAMLGRVQARYEDYLLDPAQGIRLDGHDLQRVPRWNGRLDTTYRHGPAWLRLALGGAGRYAINAYDRLTATLREESLPGYLTLDLHTGWRQGRWSLQLDARNLTDRRYFPTATYGFGSTAGYTGAVGAVAPGRTVALTLRSEL